MARSPISTSPLPLTSYWRAACALAANIKSNVIEYTSNLVLFMILLIILAIGALCGAISGLLVAYGNVTSFILTLGVGISLRGVAMLICGGRQVSGIYPPEFAEIASGFSLGLPNLFWFLIVIMIIGDFLMRYTVFGKRIYLIGANQTAAQNPTFTKNKAIDAAIASHGTFRWKAPKILLPPEPCRGSS